MKKYTASHANPESHFLLLDLLNLVPGCRPQRGPRSMPKKSKFHAEKNQDLPWIQGRHVGHGSRVACVSGPGRGHEENKLIFLMAPAGAAHTGYPGSMPNMCPLDPWPILVFFGMKF